MYWAAMIKLSIKPNETVIVEDSPVGRLGAKMSGCNTIFINEPNDIDEKLIDKIQNMDSKKIDSSLNTYINKDLNVLIPMAGRGSRFADKGYVSLNHS